MTIPEGWEISNDTGIVMFKTPEYPNEDVYKRQRSA